MTITMLERLAPGHITRSAILANDNYIISNFPFATPPCMWLINYDLVQTPYATANRSLSAKRKGQGGLRFKFRFDLMNNGMFRYLYTNLGDGQLTFPTTMYVRARLTSNSNAAYQAIQGMIDVPELTGEALGAGDDIYYFSPEFTFFKGKVAPP